MFSFPLYVESTSETVEMEMILLGTTHLNIFIYILNEVWPLKCLLRKKIKPLDNCS